MALTMMTGLRAKRRGAWRGALSAAVLTGLAGQALAQSPYDEAPAAARPAPERPLPPIGGGPSQPGGAPAVARPAAPARLPQVVLSPDQMALLLRTLADAPSHGFSKEAFLTPEMEDLLHSPSAASRRHGQDLLAAAILRYASAVHTGRLAAADFVYEWGLHPAPYDPAPGFADAVTGDRLAAWLASLPPPYQGYENLRHSLDVYRGIAQDGGWDVMASGPDLKPGVRDQRVPALRDRLAVEDPLVSPSPSPVYDDALVQAVMRAQKRFGLEPSGVVKASLITALNVPIGERVEQIIANMERWRWLPPTLPVDRIQVNIAAAVLTVFHQDAPVLSMRAATGRPGDETPMLQSQIHSIVLNPPWNVPASIATKELWPKERKHPGYLARNDYVVVTGPDGGKRLVQQAGDKAALGHVKFDFPNQYGVYLHDTPSHGTFAKYARMVSHGCVRLERPVDLANAVMAGDERWTPQAINDAIDAGDTVRAVLPKPIAVFLLYWTAYAGPDGQTNFRADPYGWDQVLMQRIVAQGRSGA